MIKDIRLGNRVLGLEQPVFISAEVGTTCNGDFETAKKLIKAAKDAGMDAVKFQILDPLDKYSDHSLTYTYKRFNGEEVTENFIEMLKKYVQPKENWRALKEYADELGIIMFATPDHMAAVDLMEELGMPAYKVATWDVTWYPFLRKIACTKKPVVLDFGASDKEEIARILKIFEEEGNDQLILLHCYHTNDFAQMNIRTVEYLREAFGHLSGYSADDANHDLDFMSLPYRPVYIEKRLTLNREDPNHHHGKAAQPEEMVAYVQRIHELSKARGVFDVRPTEGDLRDKFKYFRRIVVYRDLKAGETLTEENTMCKRPLQGGVDPQYLPLFLGRTVKRAMKENEPVQWVDLE